MLFNLHLTFIGQTWESSLISKSTLQLLEIHGCLQVPDCGFSALHDVHGLFKMPERVSRRWIAHTSGSRLGPSVSPFSFQSIWLDFSTLLVPWGSQMDCCQGQQTQRAEKVTALRLSLLVDQRSLAHHLRAPLSAALPPPRPPSAHKNLISVPHLRSLLSLISVLALSALWR